MQQLRILPKQDGGSGLPAEEGVRCRANSTEVERLGVPDRARARSGPGLAGQCHDLAGAGEHVGRGGCGGGEFTSRLPSRLPCAQGTKTYRACKVIDNQE